VRLDVGVLRAEKRFRAIDCQLFDLVRKLTATVITSTGIALRVFVGENRTHRFEHGFRDEVLRGDQLEAGGLAPRLFAQQVRNLRIHGVQRPIHALLGERC